MNRFIAGVGALAIATCAWAWQQTGAGTITYLGSGWNADAIFVATTAQQLSGTGCASSAYYTTDPTSAERKAHHAVLLMAHATGKAVVITVDGCYGNYPRIIGVGIAG